MVVVSIQAEFGVLFAPGELNSICDAEIMGNFKYSAAVCLSINNVLVTIHTPCCEQFLPELLSIEEIVPD